VFTGNVARDQDLATEEEFLATEMFREFFAPMDVGRVATGIVFGIDCTDQLPVVCSCNRPLAEPFTPEDLFRLELVAPPPVACVGRRAPFATSGLETRLQPVGTRSATAGRGAVQSLGGGLPRQPGCRGHAERQRRPGLGDTAGCRRPHRFAHLDAAQAGGLERRFARSPVARSGGGHALIVERPSGAPPYALRHSKLPHGNEFGRGATAPLAIAFIDDGSFKLEADVAVLRSRYGLSTAEVRVALGAADGLSVDELPVMLGIRKRSIDYAPCGSRKTVMSTLRR